MHWTKVDAYAREVARPVAMYLALVSCMLTCSPCSPGHGRACAREKQTDSAARTRPLRPPLSPAAA
eukprot:356408-Chlamydomonas_euryale.AAC.4